MSSFLAHRTRIKICGLTREADVDAAVEAGADAIGLVLYNKSPRYVDAARAGVLARRLPPFVTPVVLLVNASPSLVQAALNEVPNALLQFHGDETPAECEASQRPYLRAARMAPGFDLLNFSLSFASAQAMLVDAHVEGYGGGGQVFDWTLLPRQLARPMILSGGLHPGNVAAGVRAVRPWAVDVSSGVEVGKGLKDTGLMRQFCQAVREADRSCAEAA
ncbi:MAG: phosphoribosylanthranilate isomerase [Aquabacterium sp.]|jgi:phosphoribosylanthranilate isomerase|uniref:phosphoribosylanthranilate isomerase n=1 Tax=Aquabacterium sp. TaxID=1872578 RepID=UPI001B3E25F9|nr:phosphoribosylanthranilate isomerase [Aquabacterium sp.]MBP7131442.1 phosphoribosylanthranilate isomerase [Aquabacterium sp.]MDQ5927336.1 N-(5-phosphoribosyl)anthranilate isomerase [Pseudomonadota bacterium]